MVLTQPLYRRWRSQTFAEVVGQEHVTRTLRNSVRSGRIHHAYLFAGPRGTGKTSTGRILAKAVNCLALTSDGEPCNRCAICVEMNEGRSLDLIEIDAASNRKIEHIRDLREAVRLAPVTARYKVYIIDEVHMLTTEAANALLKTLEEPPPQVVFILATTELHRVPATIASRCQRFLFRRIPPAAARARLETICRAEGIRLSPQTLDLIVNLSGGSLRDAENLLDQLVAHFGTKIDHEAARELLGYVEDSRALGVVQAVFAGDIPHALRLVNAVREDGYDLRQFNREVIGHLRSMLLLAYGLEDEVEAGPSTVEALRPLAEATDPQTLAGLIRTFNGVNFGTDPGWPLPLELAVVEAGRLLGSPAQPAPAPHPESSAASRPEASAPPVTRADILPRRDQMPRPGPAGETPPTVETPLAMPEPPVPAPVGEIPPDFKQQLAEALKARGSDGRKVAGLLEWCEGVEADGDRLVFIFSNRLFRDKAADPLSRRILDQTVRRLMGRRYELGFEVRTEDRTARLERARADPVVRVLEEEFGGEVLDVR
jgi:DNA polymerase-3 subunit gamma/tau